MLTGNRPAMPAKTHAFQSRFTAPKMVASTPKVNAGFGFGSSLQLSAPVAQASRSRVVMSGAESETAQDQMVMQVVNADVPLVSNQSQGQILDNYLDETADKAKASFDLA